MEKLKSRKFWISVAAFLASIATSIAGLATVEPMVATAGIVCGVLAAAIYAASEAYVDGVNRLLENNHFSLDKKQAKKNKK